MRRALSAGCCGLLLSGCAFFGVEHLECLDQGDCPGEGDSGQGSGGEFAGGAAGDGDVVSSGGTPGDGGEGGGDSGGTSSGGAPTGGASSGGTGSGGQATGGTGPSIAGELSINEFHYRYVEIFYAGMATDPQSLDAYRIVVDDDESKACMLTGAAVNESSPFLLVQLTSSPCIGGSNCVVDCPFMISEGSVIQLQEFDGAIWSEVDLVDEYNESVELQQSFQATMDGGDVFAKLSETAGRSNQ